MFCNYDSWLMIPPPTPTLKQNKVKCVSSNHKKQFYPYGSSEPLKTAGCFTAEVAVVDVAVEAEFIVIEGNLGPGIARRETATQLKVLSLSPNFCVNSMQKENLFQKCKSYFKGLGKLKDFQLNIPIDPRVKPVVQSMHRLYFSLRCDYSNRGTWKKTVQSVQRFLKTKDSQDFRQADQYVHRFEGCFLRRQVRSKDFKVFNGWIVETWILLVPLSKKLRIFCLQKSLWLDNLLASAPVRVVAL